MRTEATSSVSPPPAEVRFAEADTWLGAPRRDRRWLRVACIGWVLALSVIAPVLFLAGKTERMSSSIARPEFTWPQFWNGSYMPQVERWLQEQSPLTYVLRGCYVEARYVLGVADSQWVVFGSDGWLFRRTIVDAGARQFRAFAAPRRAGLAALRDRWQKLGVRVLAVPAPDKVSVYPEMLPGRATYLAERATCYPAMLAELAELGIAAVDVRTPMLAAKGPAMLYLRTDTHWSDQGARVAVREAAKVLASPAWVETTGAATRLRNVDTMVLGVGDLVMQLGMRATTRSQRPMTGPLRSLEAVVDSAVVGSLREIHDHIGVVSAAAPAEFANYEAVMSTAAIAVCGDSFAARGFRALLPVALQRLVDWRFTNEGAHPFDAMTQCLDAIERGDSKAKVIVWEFVERKMLAPGQ